MSWGGRGGRDEAQKAAKWLLRQSFKAQEQSDAQTVYLLNLLQEQRQELEARDSVMRESTVLVSNLQREIDSLRQQLAEYGAPSLTSSGTHDSRPNPAPKPVSRLSPATGTSSEGGTLSASGWRHQRSAKDLDTSRAAGSTGGCEGSNTRPGHVHPCSTLEEAWSRMRRGPHTASAAPGSSSSSRSGGGGGSEGGEACRETPFSPSTPQPRSRSPLDLRAASTSSPSPLPALPPCPAVEGDSTTPAAGGISSVPAQPPAASSSTSTSTPGSTGGSLPGGAPHPAKPSPPVEDGASAQLSPPVPPPSHPPPPRTPQPNPPPDPPSSLPLLHLQPPPQPQPQSQQQQPLLPQADRERYESQLQSLRCQVASLQSQLEAARHQAAEATSSYLTCKTDLGIMARKYDSLMLQKLEVEEQRDRLFSPHLDIQVIRAAMPAVDAALAAAEGRLEEAVDRLAACQAEAEDAVRVQNQQRSKWIAKLEGLQAQLAEREARLAEVEAQMEQGQGRGAAMGGVARELAAAGVCGGVGAGSAPAVHVSAWVGGGPVRAWAAGEAGPGSGSGSGQAAGSTGGVSVASCDTASSSGGSSVGSGTSGARSSSGSVRSSGGGSAWEVRSNSGSDIPPVAAVVKQSLPLPLPA